MNRGQDIIGKARQALDLDHSTASSRIYDMILSYGTREYVDNKKKIVHYNFFDDPDHQAPTGSTAWTSR